MEKQPSLKPQDVVVALKLVVEQGGTYLSMSGSLGMAASQIHGSIRRLILSGLVTTNLEGTHPNRSGLKEFLVHGLKYVFPAVRGPMARGVLTAGSAPMFSAKFQVERESSLVWPHAEGDSRGMSIIPLHHSVPFVAQNDPRLYEVFAAIDMLRTGSARERELATRVFEIFLD